MSATVVILALTVLVSVLAFRDRRLFDTLAFEPFVVHARNDLHRFVTHALVHADWPHLFVNMYVLYGFGPFVEGYLTGLTPLPGSWLFVILYVTAAVVACVPGYGRHKHDPRYRAVGASGAVSAVLFAHILILPTAEVGLFLLPFGLPSAVFGALYLIYEGTMHRRGGDHVAHDAHLMGALHGVLFVVVLRPALVPAFFHSLTELLPG
ncbi:MAG: rhomboid family intramembrane serine protease [Flavobacteriales bacterium]|jgi:membrane associated rhomboid family serine protease|nr:rhomboid family intramembrane serine protease [Flavobacteriales bacterium]MBK7941131.1 rhomboid family intramembrane serine protease [Flavobacteriales bacterium]MBK9701157.1 rhomboid family intramembrane serine protease [Flavobacteriales bacterium]